MMTSRIWFYLILLILAWEHGSCKTQQQQLTEQNKFLLQLLSHYRLQSDKGRNDQNGMDINLKCIIDSTQQASYYEPERVSCTSCWDKVECSDDPYCLANCQTTSPIRQVIERLEHLERRQYIYAIAASVIICIALLCSGYQMVKLYRRSCGNLVKPCHPTGDREDILPGVVRENRIFVHNNGSPQIVSI